MKIKDWIAVGGMLFLATASRSLGANDSSVLEQIELSTRIAQQLSSQLQNSGQESSASTWPELEKFQASLWRAMALDPTLPILVQAPNIPQGLYAAELTRELETQFTELKKSTLPEERQVNAEFKQYVATVSDILENRRIRRFPQARVVAKRGTLDSHYELLKQKLGTAGSKDLGTGKLTQQLLNQLERTKDSWNSFNRDGDKKAIFGNGNSNPFSWILFALAIGFLIGLFAVRYNPEAKAAPTLTLDYQNWLREFEEHLTRFKTSQVSHERRIEEVVNVSEKMTQQALSLYSDPRIKNETHLETRMSNLLRETQYQFEQSQKLSKGDRVQIQLVLEHCLKLCDAFERNQVPKKPGHTKSA